MPEGVARHRLGGARRRLLPCREVPRRAGASCPDDLIWFKWEAYLTWVTGFALLVVQYYLNATPG